MQQQNRELDSAEHRDDSAEHRELDLNAVSDNTNFNTPPQDGA